MEAIDKKEKLAELLGAMIALGRACEGNKNRPDAASHKALLSAMRLTVPGTMPDCGEIEKCLENLRFEKQKLVPRCSSCEKQCGRNDEYSIYEIKSSSTETAALKEALLLGLLSMEPLMRFRLSETIFEESMAFLYDGLFWVGKECKSEDLAPVLVEMLRIKQELLSEAFSFY